MAVFYSNISNNKNIKGTMEKSYSLFRTSMQPSMYINPVYVFDSKSTVLVPEKSIKIENIINKERTGEPTSVRSGGFCEYKKAANDASIIRVSPINMILRPITFSIKEGEKPNDIVFRINAVSKPEDNTTSPKIYSKKIKVSNSSLGLDKASQRKVKIFTEENKVFYINGNEFYRSNNMRNDIWWSSEELKRFRDMFMEEVSRHKRNQPWLSYKQCVEEVCK